MACAGTAPAHDEPWSRSCDTMSQVYGEFILVDYYVFDSNIHRTCIYIVEPPIKDTTPYYGHNTK